jgi:hypothetical protein
MEEFIITKDLVNAVLAYLQVQRWVDVEKLIHELLQVKPVEKEAEKV